VVSLIAIGASLAISSRRGEGGDHVRKLVIVAGSAVFIGAAAKIVQALTEAGPMVTGSEPIRGMQSSVWLYAVCIQRMGSEPVTMGPASVSAWTILAAAPMN